MHPSVEEKEEKDHTDVTKAGTTNMGKFVKKSNGSSDVSKCGQIIGWL